MRCDDYHQPAVSGRYRLLAALFETIRRTAVHLMVCSLKFEGRNLRGIRYA